MRLALYQPDIAGNTGAIFRLAACFAVAVDIIEPAGFVLNDSKLKRAAMDYVDHVTWVRHPSWRQFLDRRADGRLILLTTRAVTTFTDFAFQPTDTLLLGRESAGAPDTVHDTVDDRIAIPTAPGMRSHNVAVAAAIVLSEALRQTGWFGDTATNTAKC